MQVSGRCCTECSVFSHFLFQGQFKFSKYKNHIVKVHELAITLFCMCVCLDGREASRQPSAAPGRARLSRVHRSWRTAAAKFPATKGLTQPQKKEAVAVTDCCPPVNPSHLQAAVSVLRCVRRRGPSAALSPAPALPSLSSHQSGCALRLRQRLPRLWCTHLPKPRLPSCGTPPFRHCCT